MTRFALVLLAAGLAWADPSADLRALVRKSVLGLQREDLRRGDFLYRVRNERNELDSAGKVANSHSHVWERIEIDGFTFGRTLERDGKPLSTAERKGEEAAIQKQLAEWKATPPAAAAERRNTQNEWYQEFPEALDYKLAGEETIAGRATLRLEATPRPGYQARNMRARVFEKLNATLWIDKATSELVKAEAEMFDTVNVGFGLVGRVDKGTRLRLQRRQVTDGIWLIDAQSLRFSARFLMFKSIRNEATTEWSDFRHRTKTLASR
jgi:hypothetical protein